MSDRGRDVSEELSEVRTVLGRAESALSSLRGYRAMETAHKYYVTEEGWGATRVVPYEHDPDTDEMIERLDEVVTLLSPWRRTGRKKKS